MTTRSRERRGLSRLAVLCMPVAASLVLPTVAMAAAGGSTVRATISGDGSVKTVKVYAPGGGVSSFSGTLPLKLSISRSVSGSTSTYTYHVENTFSKQQTVTYTDTAGKSHTASVELQLPLVAQLGVELPSSFKNVSTPNGVVETDPDGVNRLLFNLVLFSPLGAPTQDVTFTATGKGAPTAELAATTVNPATTSGLSQAGQDANASAQQDDFWQGYASGGNGGLTQLATGMAQMVSGLNQLAPGAHKLADGLKAAGAGANKLDAGTKSAYDGSKKIAVGTKAAHAGAGQLSTGLGQIHTGQQSLTDGLTKIHAGLALLDGSTPQAVQGLSLIEAGVKALRAGVGDDTTPKTLINGVDLIRDGLSGELSGLLGAGTLASPQGLTGAVGCTAHILQVALTTGEPLSVVQQDPCMVAAGITTAVTGQAAFAADPGTAGQLGLALQNLLAPSYAGLTNPDPTKGVVAGLQALYAGSVAVRTGLSHTPNPADPTDHGGVAEGLAAVDGGLLQLLDPATGLPAAVAGLDQLNKGSGDALTGSQQLTDGSGKAFDGSKALDSGLGQLETGTAALADGLGQLSAGQHQVATGLPAAVTGSAQIATGADQLQAGAVKVHDGILAVQTGAVGPLVKQLTEGSQNAKKQLAILDAAGALASEAPGGAGTSYVLSQSPNGFRLAAATSSSGSNTGRNVGIGLGGFAALVVAVIAGFALGRRSGVSA